MRDTPVRRWAVLWRSRNRLDGTKEYTLWSAGDPLLFKTRQSARAYIAEKYGYIRHRPDLQREPHGWRLPIPVRVRVIIEREKQ